MRTIIATISVLSLPILTLPLAANPIGGSVVGGNGNATIPWYVFVFGFGQKNVQATVYAVATDQNGQQARSQVETVQVQSNGGGG